MCRPREFNCTNDYVGCQLYIGGNNNLLSNPELNQPVFDQLQRKHPMGSNIVGLSLRYFGVVCSFQGVRIGHGLRLNVGLSENFVESVGLLDSKEANTKDQSEGQGSHDDTPDTHSEEEQGNEKVDNVSSTEGEENLSDLGAFNSGHNWVGCLNGNAQHNQTYQGDEGSDNQIKVNSLGREMDSDGNVELHRRRRI